ncbi:MAG: LexA family transcriptional regulator [Armatimonadetes bacterium]|nr:LexA family transcriptional regulator [Armatimonadota bacterium]
MTLDDAVAELCRVRGWTQADLARILGMSISNVSRRMSGQRRFSTADVAALAHAAGVAIVAGSSGWVLTSEPSASPVPEGQPFAVNEDRGLPIAASAGAGPAQEYDELAERMTTAALNWYHAVDALVQVHGASMQPVYYDGDVIGVRHCGERDCREGRLVVARWRQYGTTIVKVYRGDVEGRLFLQSLNTPADIVLGEREDLEIIGRPMGLMRTREVDASF